MRSFSGWTEFAAAIERASADQQGANRLQSTVQLRQKSDPRPVMSHRAARVGVNRRNYPTEGNNHETTHGGASGTRRVPRRDPADR
jgi:hypothetical protein